MKIKNYIAVLLVSIFMVKSVAIEANGLNLLFSGSDITFVNPHCKKENLLKKSEDTPSFSQLDLSSAQMMVLSGQCTTPLQFELFSWDINFSESIAIFNEYFSSRLSYRYLDNLSPPPRLA